MEQNPIVHVAMHIQELLMLNVDLDQSKAFYACKERFGGMAGVNKDQFKAIFDRTKAETLKPLSQAGYVLAKTEQRLKDALIDALYQIRPDGPEQTRELMSIAGQLRDEQSRIYMAGIDRALGKVDDELKAEVVKCWPSLVKED